MSRICRAAFVVFAALYLLAVFVLAAGSFGWFGQARDPLSGVYLLLLGLPWNRLSGGITGIWILIAAPAVNLALIAGLCRFGRAGRQ